VKTENFFSSGSLSQWSSLCRDNSI